VEPGLSSPPKRLEAATIRKASHADYKGGLLRPTKELAATDELRAGQWRTDRHDDCSAEYLGRCGYPHSKA